MKKQLIFLISILLLISSCSEKEERLLFSSSRNGNSDIFIMDANGENMKALTQTDFEEWGPTWINKNEICFLRQTKDSIFRIKLNLKTDKESKLYHPTNCLLDDKNVLYYGKLELYTCKNDIFIYNSRTKETIDITENIVGVANYPSWSHDGKSVIFTSNHLGNNQLFKYELDSKKIMQLTDSNANNERGELSPNGKLLVYSSDYFEKGNQDILVKNLENGDIKNISKSPGIELIARFSHDGNKIFFGTNQDDNWEIYFYNSDTEKQTRLTTSNEFDGDPRVLKYK
ncbi:TolB family protein [Tenacibaculum sp. MEBiC06402]|uniref:TolB family protein n=1 Tax=unclassified Tenacibaculum TaxID=2635139 RepID=UPI003B99725A